MSAVPESPRVYPWLVTLTLTAAMVLSLIDRMVISLLVVPIQQELHLSDTDMGWILGVAFGLFYSIMGLPLGWLVDRSDRIRLIVCGIGLWALMTVASGLARNFWELFACRVGVGIGEAVLAPAAWSLLADVLPAAHRARGLSVFQFGALSGTGLGMLAGGWVYGLSAGDAFAGVTVLADISPWRTVFLLAASPALPVIALLLLFRDPRAHTSQRDTRGGLRTAWRFIADQARVLPVMFLGMSSIILMIYSVSSWAPTLAARRFGVGADVIGNDFGLAILAGGLGGVLAGGWLTDRQTARGDRRIYSRILLAAGIAVMPAAWLLALTPSYPMLLAAVCLFFLCASFPNGVLVAYIQRATPQPVRGIVGALYVLVVNLVGYLVGPPGVAFIAARFGHNDLGTGLLVLSVLAGSIGVTLFMLARKPSVRLLEGAVEDAAPSGFR